MEWPCIAGLVGTAGAGIGWLFEYRRRKAETERLRAATERDKAEIAEMSKPPPELQQRREDYSERMRSLVSQLLRTGDARPEDIAEAESLYREAPILFDSDIPEIAEELRTAAIQLHSKNKGAESLRKSPQYRERYLDALGEIREAQATIARIHSELDERFLPHLKLH